MIINATNLAALQTGFKAAFNTGFRKPGTFWQIIATLVPSTNKLEAYGWLGQFPKMREWLGDRQIKSMSVHDYSIKNKKFESTIGVDRDDIDDDSYGVLSPLFEEMGYAAATHPDELVFALLAAGFATLCHDGQYFFDTDHPVGNEETGITSVSNMQAGAGNPWYLMDLRRPLKPLIFQKRREYAFTSMDKPGTENVFMRDQYLYGVDARANVGFGFWQQAFGSKATLDKTNFDAAIAAMMSFKSDEGKPLNINPSHLITGSTNRATALEVVKAERSANGATNTNRNAVDVVIVPWLP